MPLSFQIFTLSLKMSYVLLNNHFLFSVFALCSFIIFFLTTYAVFSLWLFFQSQYFHLVLVYNFYIYFTYVFMKGCQRPSPLSTNMSELLKSPYGQLNFQMPISSFYPSFLNEHHYSVRCLVK